MQKGYQKHFRERAVYYTTYPINEQGRLAHDLYLKEKAESDSNTSRTGDIKFNWDYNLTPVTVVAILNFKFDHDKEWPRDKFHSSYRLREDNCHEVMTDVLRFVFLELGRFNKRLWELDSIFDKWMYLLKHIHEMVEIPKEFKDPLFTRLFLLAEIRKFTSEEYKQYKKSLENMGELDNIINSTEERAEMRGREAGRAEGRAEGSQEKALEIAKNLLEAGMVVEQISQMTGLSVEEVEAIALSQS